MITNNDLADAIAALVEQAFPGEKLYRDFVPSGFERPSNLIQMLDGKAFPDFSCWSMDIRPRFMLSTFVPVDPYDHGDAMELVRRQMSLLGLFLPGYIKVKDRAPHVQSEILMENDLDAASIIVPFSYTLSREEFMEIQQYPEMGTIHIRQEVTTHG